MHAKTNKRGELVQSSYAHENDLLFKIELILQLRSGSWTRFLLVTQRGAFAVISELYSQGVQLLGVLKLWLYNRSFLSGCAKEIMYWFSTFCKDFDKTRVRKRCQVAKFLEAENKVYFQKRFKDLRGVSSLTIFCRTVRFFVFH